jgi:hypothetical protein
LKDFAEVDLVADLVVEEVVLVVAVVEAEAEVEVLEAEAEVEADFLEAEAEVEADFLEAEAEVEVDFLEAEAEVEVEVEVEEVCFVDTTVEPPATVGSAGDFRTPTIIPIMPTEEAMEATATATRPPTTIQTITTIMQRQTRASAETPMSWPLYPPNNRHV